MFVKGVLIFMFYLKISVREFLRFGLRFSKVEMEEFYSLSCNHHKFNEKYSNVIGNNMQIQ